MKHRDLDRVVDYAVRDWLTRANIWGVPSDEALDALARRLRGLRVLEVMAGPGLLAQGLLERGVDLVATDRDPRAAFVTKMDAAEAVRTLAADVVVMSWPPYTSPAGYRVAAEMRVGQSLVYIGEGMYGCTGDAALHWALDQCFELVEEIDWFHCPGLYDRCKIFTKTQWVPAPESHLGMCFPKELLDENPD